MKDTCGDEIVRINDGRVIDVSGPVRCDVECQVFPVESGNFPTISEVVAEENLSFDKVIFLNLETLLICRR